MFHFNEELSKAGWVKSEDFDDCWVRDWDGLYLMITLFFEEDPSRGCLLFEANGKSGEYWSCTAGTIETGFPSINSSEEGDSMVMNLVGQLFGKLNSMIKKGDPLPFDISSARVVVDTFELFDYDGGE